jgi:hypothetical protein
MFRQILFQHLITFLFLWVLWQLSPRFDWPLPPGASLRISPHERNESRSPVPPMIAPCAGAKARQLSSLRSGK